MLHRPASSARMSPSVFIVLGFGLLQEVALRTSWVQQVPLSKTSAIQAVGTGSITKGRPFFFSQLVSMIEDGRGTFTCQRGNWRYLKLLKCPQIPLCGQLKRGTYLFPIQAAEPRELCVK